MSNWNQDNFAKTYLENSIDPELNWFEHKLNFPLLMGLLPKDAKRVLDFGCGPGEFTNELARHFQTVEGCDYSGAMVRLATASYPNLRFFVWSDWRIRPSVAPYDAVFSKLTLQFVEDLVELADSLRHVLKNNGVFAFSVPHPFSTINKINDYWSSEAYDTEIGGYGINTTMIHRSLQDYLSPFIQNGFELVDIIEPKITDDMAKNFGVIPERLRYPRRLNVRFRIVHN